jgi:hypothetical protein
VLHPYSAGDAYINFDGRRTGMGEPSFHNNYGGLAEKKYDPTNFFCVSQNLKHSGMGPKVICCGL